MWKRFDGRCYYVSEKTATSWSAARKECRERGGDLAIPENRANNQHIYEAVKERNVGRAWIGVYRDAENKFLTVEDIEVPYNNWSNNEPNNLGGKEDCVEIWDVNGNAVASATWNDLTCNRMLHFICQL
jgi:hypothetical protein